MTSIPLRSRPIALRRRLIVWGVGLASLTSWALIFVTPFTSAESALNFSVGESATVEVLAPRPLSFPSPLLTTKAREQAENAVPTVYDPPDARVARQQVLRLRDILDFVNTIRADSLASPDQKASDLRALTEVTLAPEITTAIITFSEAQWQSTQTEALSVLEQIMRNAVRADQVEEARRLVPARVGLDLNEDQAQVVVAFVRELIAPNSLYNAEATQANRQAAAEAIGVVYRTVVTGQAIIERGRVITEEDLETLTALGLLQTNNQFNKTASALLLVVVAFTLLTIYILRFNLGIGTSIKQAVLLGILTNGFLLAAKLMVPGHTILPFLFPAAALAMLLTVIVDSHFAVIVAVAMSMLVAYIGDNDLELATYTALGSIFAVLTLGRAERVSQFFWAGLAGAVANASIVVAFRLTTPNIDSLGIAQLLIASLINGGVSASLTLGGFFLLGGVFDITTHLQLIELARPDHPMLRFILRSAPGTYQHSLQVANLAEQAAERIGANALLIRVGALYHDAGKAQHPEYFVENQLDGVNPHEGLDPYISAGIIIAHVTDGMKMAATHRLPSRIRAFISEHHGTLKTSYQYQRAVQAAGGDSSKVDATKFAYPGPRPSSKETAILMLADGCEAKARSDRPRSEEDIDRIVKFVIDDRMAKAQLDDTDLTLYDLQLIRASFVSTLKGVFHPRIQYPEEKAEGSK